MSWPRSWAAMAVLATGCTADAPSRLLPNDPSITQHSVELASSVIPYKAEAGLMPVPSPSGDLLGDMSYFAYTTASQKNRPIAFIWNGGPGSNGTPLNYGAFGPRRLQGQRLFSNPGTLLDVADLVFVDQMETGYGRMAPNAERRFVLTPDGDAETFAQFITTFLKTHCRTDSPVVIVGESYGVPRAVRVTEKLIARGVNPRALVFISGYQAVGTQLSRGEFEAFRQPGKATLAFVQDNVEPVSGRSVREVFDQSVSSARAQSDHVNLLSSPPAVQSIPTLRVPAGLYDTRYKSDGSEWISRAVVEDIRSSLRFSIDRVYRGQEFDQHYEEEPAAKSGLAASTISSAALFRTDIVVEPVRPATGKPSPVVPLLTSAPRLRLLIVGGIFDGIFPCAVGQEMARRDLASFTSRVQSKCYLGGHMMYDKTVVGHELSDDVRAFIVSIETDAMN